MSLTLGDEIQNRLEWTRRQIASEFSDLPQDEVDARFDVIVAGLLDEATFGDFVPVLAWRYSREQLLAAMAGMPAEFRG